MSINKYSYDGPVMEFTTCVTPKWYGSTYAISESKARSNLSYQYKVTHGRTPDSSVSLPGKLTIN